MSRRSRLCAVGLGWLLLSSIGVAAYAFSNGEDASVVIGQPDFTGSAPSSTQTGLAFPVAVAFDSAGNLWVADEGNNRVLEFPIGSGFSDGEAASIVIGQPNFASNASAATQSGLYGPADVAFDRSGNLWVADQGNNRVLEFTAPFTNGENASVVLGQPDFTSKGNATTQSGMDIPSGLAFDAAGDLWVVDQGNNRVLEYAPPFTDGEEASLVIGQSNFTTRESPGFGANGLFLPSMVAFDPSGDLWVSDTFESTVLEFARPFSNGEAASVVIGGVSTSFTATPNTLSDPEGVAFGPSGDLWVGDSLNGRAVAFAPPFAANESASVVVGKADLTSGGVFSSTPTTQTGLRFPHGIALDSSGNLWVADSNNNRVVEFPAAGSAPASSSTTGPSLSYEMQVNIKYDQLQPANGVVNGTTQLDLAITLNETGLAQLGFPIFPTGPGTLVGLGTGVGTFTATVDSCQQGPATRNYTAYVLSNASLTSGRVGFSYGGVVNTDIGDCVTYANYNTVDDLIASCFSTQPNSTNGACSSFPISGGTKAITMGPNATVGPDPFTSISGSASLELVSSTGYVASTATSSSSSTLTAPEFPAGALAAVALISVAGVAVISRRAWKPPPP